jgi:diguanylate cyclase (GGDEF)-like protein
LFGGLSLAVTGMIEMAQIPGLIAPWWIGDYAGLVTVAPLFGLVLARFAERFGFVIPQGVRRLLGHGPWRALFPDAVAKLSLLLLSALLILVLAAAFPAQTAILFLLFICLIIQLWIVHSESELAALLGILSFSLVMAMAAGLMGLDDQVLMLQFLVIAMAVSSYLGLAVPALYRDNTRMRQLLTRDGLTGALSRSFFEDAVRDSIGRLTQRRQPGCLVMIDLDGLKPINDRYGHAAGDMALKTLAEACALNLAPGQLLGRLSGDEFAMFLAECDRDEAERVVAAIREDLEAGPPLAEREQVRASFGIAELGANGGLDYRGLLALADQAMYTDKRR